MVKHDRVVASSNQESREGVEPGDELLPGESWRSRLEGVDAVEDFCAGEGMQGRHADGQDVGNLLVRLDAVRSQVWSLAQFFCLLLIFDRLEVESMAYNSPIFDEYQTQSAQVLALP